MSDQVELVQTIALQTSGPDAQAFFAVVTPSELAHASAAPHLFLNDAELAFWQTLRMENKRQSALQGRIALQEVAQPFGHGEHPLPYR